MSEVLDADQASGAVRWEVPRLAGGTATRGGAPPTAGELESLERAASAEGYARGRTEGYAAGMVKAKTDAEQLRRILDHFARPLRELGDELEQIVVHLATAVAGALVRARSAREPEVIEALVREALAALPAAAREVEVLLHPEDLAAIEPLMGERDPGIRLAASGKLLRGDVRVNSDLVRLDATLATRLANAVEALLSKP